MTKKQPKRPKKKINGYFSSLKQSISIATEVDVYNTAHIQVEDWSNKMYLNFTKIQVGKIIKELQAVYDKMQ